jgi:hypothetical protein
MFGTSLRNGTARYKKRKQLFQYQHLLLLVTSGVNVIKLFSFITNDQAK